MKKKFDCCLISTDDRSFIMKRIAELENEILEAAPSDNWDIGEQSFVKSSQIINKFDNTNTKL